MKPKSMHHRSGSPRAVQHLAGVLALLVVAGLGAAGVPATAVGASPSRLPAATAEGCSTTLPNRTGRCAALAGHVFGHRCREYSPDRTNENTIAALREVGAKSLGCESDTPRIAGDDGASAEGASVIFHDLNQLTRVTSKASRAAAGIPTDATIA